ncbi:hypothetical protein OHR68_03920 [Spirillospora sp. NBC_00431]
MTSKTREPVSEAAWALTLFVSVASSLLRNLLDDDLSRYAAYVFLGVAASVALVLLVQSIRFGVESWSWAVATLVSVAVGLVSQFG